MMSFITTPGNAWVLPTLLVALFFLLLVIVVLLYALYARQKGFDAAFSRTIGEEREKTLSRYSQSNPRGIPTSIYIPVSLLVVALLFTFIKYKKQVAFLLELVAIIRETRPKLLREAAVGNLRQWTRV